MKISVKSFVCPHCSGKEEMQLLNKKYDPVGRKWTTKAERDADPSLAANCNGSGPLLWKDDPTWIQCGHCKRDLDKVHCDLFNEEYEKFIKEWVANGMPTVTEIGCCIVNDRAIARVEFETNITEKT